MLLLTFPKARYLAEACRYAITRHHATATSTKDGSASLHNPHFTKLTKHLDNNSNIESSLTNNTTNTLSTVDDNSTIKSSDTMGKILSNTEIVLAAIQKLDNAVQKLDNDIQEITGSKGRANARKCTVALKVKDDLSDPFLIGHGMVTRLPRVGKYVVLTAAHVVADAVEYNSYKKSLVVQFSTGDEWKFNKGKLEVFIPDDYAREGKKDVGAIYIPDELTTKWDTETKEVNIDNSVRVDKEYFGQTSDYNIRGHAWNVSGDRVRLLSPSQPGCSGSPIFAPTGEILAMLHGEQKHRSRTLRHSASNTDDTVTSHVYVDRVKDLGRLSYLNPKDADVFSASELLSDEEWNSRNHVPCLQENSSDGENLSDGGDLEGNSSSGENLFSTILSNLHKKAKVCFGGELQGNSSDGDKLSTTLTTFYKKAKDSFHPDPVPTEDGEGVFFTVKGIIKELLTRRAPPPTEKQQLMDDLEISLSRDSLLHVVVSLRRLNND